MAKIDILWNQWQLDDSHEISSCELVTMELFAEKNFRTDFF